MTTEQAVLMCYYHSAYDVVTNWYNTIESVIDNTDCDYEEMDELDITILSSATDCAAAFFKTVLKVIHKMYTYLNRVEVSALNAEEYLEYTINCKIIAEFENFILCIENKAALNPDEVERRVTDLLQEVSKKIYKE